MVIREYLVENLGFDDRLLKTMGMGKQTDMKPGAEWGTNQILLYPAGVEIPPTVERTAPIAEVVHANEPAKPPEPTATKP